MADKDTTTITVSVKNRDRLMRDKYLLKAVTIDEVLDKYFEMVRRLKLAGELK